jgi:hypothetical protein
MKIILRLVGFSEIEDNNKYVYDIYFTSLNKFNFSILKNIFLKLTDNINEAELDMCTVSYISMNLKKDTIFESIEINTYKTFLWCGHKEIKEKIIQIFKLYGVKNLIFSNNNEDNIIENYSIYNLINNNNISDNNISDNISDNNISDNNISDNNISDNISDNNDIKIFNNSEESELSDTEEIEDTDNESLNYNIQLFEDPDFIKLLSIYKNKPHLLKELYNFISSSKIIIIPTKNVIINEEKVKIIKDICNKENLNFNDEDINNSLKLTNNNINLSIRYLLNNTLNVI